MPKAPFVTPVRVDTQDTFDAYGDKVRSGNGENMLCGVVKFLDLITPTQRSASLSASHGYADDDTAEVTLLFPMGTDIGKEYIVTLFDTTLSVTGTFPGYDTRGNPRHLQVNLKRQREN